MYLTWHPLLNGNDGSEAQGLFHFYRATRMLREIIARRGKIIFLAAVLTNRDLFVGYGADPERGFPGRNILLMDVFEECQPLSPSQKIYRLP